MWHRILLWAVVVLLGCHSSSQPASQPAGQRPSAAEPSPDVEVEFATEPASDPTAPKALVTMGAIRLGGIQYQVCPERMPEPYVMDPRAQERVVVVFKHDYLLGLYVNGHLAQTPEGEPLCYPVAMGANPREPKIRQDRASTPEGWYWIGAKQGQGQTQFYKALTVSYPNGQDAERAFQAGVINATARERIKRAEDRKVMPPQTTRMGGLIKIHGHGSYPKNWTWGCVALDNSDLDQLFEQVKARDHILILPWEERIAP